GFTDYIVGITGGDKIQKAKMDIEQAGGKVLHEISLGFNGLVVSLPSDQLQAFDAKDYIDFMEEDKAGNEKKECIMYIWFL
ncbi:hypothetical protein K501DRAFT_202119, partial [Backusella circina FSU 941]